MAEQQSDTFSKKQPIQTLSLVNREEWFQIMEDWLTGEGLFLTISTRIISSYGQITKEQVDAKARYWIRICISTNDRDWVREKKTAKEIWEALQLKYQDRLKATSRQYIQQYTTYQLPADTSIEKAWTYLGDLGRKITTS
jgi:hypothetical protein